MKAERFQQAAAECQQGFGQTNEPALGLLAARALRVLAVVLDIGLRIVALPLRVPLRRALSRA
jgi:hypothetical protein